MSAKGDALTKAILQAWSAVDAPQGLREKYPTFRLSGSDDDNMFMCMSDGELKEMAFKVWVIGKQWDGKRITDRRAVGVRLTGDEGESEILTILQAAVDSFEQRAEYFPEGGRYPEPINVAEILAA